MPTEVSVRSNDTVSCSGHSHCMFTGYTYEAPTKSHTLLNRLIQSGISQVIANTIPPPAIYIFSCT